MKSIIMAEQNIFIPNLIGDDPKLISEIIKICTILKLLGQDVNETCGAHIHFGEKYLTNIQAWKNFIELWANTELILYIIGNAKGEIPRKNIVEHATPISKDIEEQIKVLRLYDINDVNEFKKKLDYLQTKKGYSINFENLKEGRIQTVEVRISNGTLFFQTWIENIILFGGIIKASQDLSEIQAKAEKDRTEQENHLLCCFENIRNRRYDEENTLEQLLQLAIPENRRDIYRERYRINKKLLEQDKEIKEYLEAHTTSNSVKIRPEEKETTVFTTENTLKKTSVDSR